MYILTIKNVIAGFYKTKPNIKDIRNTLLNTGIPLEDSKLVSILQGINNKYNIEEL